MSNQNTRRFPAEWEQHEATWISWPANENDWPGKFPAIDWVYAEIVRHLGASERVEILCNDKEIIQRAKKCLAAHRVRDSSYRLHEQTTDRSWLRDSAPTAVYNNGKLEWVSWLFNAWAKYDNFHLDQEVPRFIARSTETSIVEARRSDQDSRFVLEGGAIDSDGAGTMLTTEECLLSKVQERNPGLDRSGYEALFKTYLGITKTIWLAGSCAGDDTHGHVDDAARFVAPGVVAVAYAEDPADTENHKITTENVNILEHEHDASGRKLTVVKLPMPEPIYYEQDRLPASFANFYIGNSVILVPTFNDPNDRRALEILSNLFPKRRVVGIHSLDLVLGFGTLHCLSQQQPIRTSK